MLCVLMFCSHSLRFNNFIQNCCFDSASFSVCVDFDNAGFLACFGKMLISLNL